MNPLRLLLLLLVVWPSVAFADLRQTIRDYETEIVAMEAAHDQWLDFEPAHVALRQAFSENGIGFSMMYVSAWGDQIYLDWDSLTGIYSKARDRLWDWRYATESGRFDEAAVERMLADGMQVLRRIDVQVDPWFRDDLRNWTERAYWLDRAHEVGCCEPLYYYYGDDLSSRAFADSISPDYSMVGRIQVFASVPEEGESFADPRLETFARLTSKAEAAVQSGDREAIRSVIGNAAAMLTYYPSPETAELRDVLMLLDDRMRFEDAPVTELLNQAEAMERGPLRDSVLRAAQYALSERLGHLAPLLAAGAAAGGDTARSSVITRLATEAKRLVMLRDDLEDPFSPPSGLLRAVSGFTAASEFLDIANNGDATAAEALAVINDFGGTFKGMVAPTAPFAAPAGLVAAQLDQTRAAFDLASEAMTGVGDAIGGDPSGLDRAMRAAEALERTLNPRNLVNKMKDGFIDGLVSNVPFARSIIGWLKD